MASRSWARQELLGPPSFEVPLRCWSVFKTATRLLREAQHEPLSVYTDDIRQLSETYRSDCWNGAHAAEGR
eukprot:7225607-Alexandrium_andersonii.AAC.1